IARPSQSRLRIHEESRARPRGSASGDRAIGWSRDEPARTRSSQLRGRFTAPVSSGSTGQGADMGGNASEVGIALRVVPDGYGSCDTRVFRPVCEVVPGAGPWARLLSVPEDPRYSSGGYAAGGRSEASGLEH